MLLAEDTLLLLTDDATGKTSVDSTTLDLVLAGAVLLELAAQGRVDVASPGEPVKPGRVVVRDSRPTGDEILDSALGIAAMVSPRKPDSMLGQLKKGLATALRARLVERGIMRADEGRVLGIFPTSRWLAADSSHEDRVRRALVDVLATARSATPTESGRIALLQAVDKVPTVFPHTGLAKRELRARAKAVAEGGFAGEAVRKAIEAINASVMAAITAASVAGAAASSS